MRVARLQLAPQRDVDDVVEMIRERGRRDEGEAGGGGNYYLTTVTRLGPAYIQLVFSAIESQAVTYPAASGLLGVRRSGFRSCWNRAQRPASRRTALSPSPVQSLTAW